MKLGNRNRTDNLQPPEKGKDVRNRTQNRPTSETNGVRTKQNGLASDQNVLYKNIKAKLVVSEERIMKRLMLIGLCLFAVAASSTALGSVELFWTGGGEASWVEDSTAPSSDGVVAKLYWPAPYRNENNEYIVPNAGVRIDIPDVAIKDIESWKYYTKAPVDYATNLTFYVDREGVENYPGRDYDMTLSAWPDNDNYGDQWLTVDQATIANYNGSYVVWAYGASSPTWKFSWSTVQSSYGDGVVIRVALDKGVIGTNQTITTYVDDFSMNGVLYQLVPEPATMVLLGLGGLFLRKRR